MQYLMIQFFLISLFSAQISAMEHVVRRYVVGVLGNDLNTPISLYDNYNHLYAIVAPNKEVLLRMNKITSYIHDSGEKIESGVNRTYFLL